MTRISIQALISAGRLERIGEELIEPDEKRVRALFATEKFVAWREDNLPYLDGHGRSDLTPDEEADDFLRRFQLGKPLTDIARLQPTADGVWEVRLQQLRLMGWFIAKDELVLAEGEDVELLKRSGSPTYDDLKRSVETQRSKLGSDYVKGDQRDVITHKETGAA